MSYEIKPVYQTRETFCSELAEVDDVRYIMRIKDAELYEGRILYPAAAYEAIQKENAAPANRIAELEELIKNSEVK